MAKEFGRMYGRTYKCYGCLEEDMGRICRMDVDSDSYYVPNGCPYDNECTSLPVNWVVEREEPEVIQCDKKAIGEKKREKLYKVRRKVEDLLEFIRDDV